MHHEIAVDSLLWFDYAKEKHSRSLPFTSSCRICSKSGDSYDQLNLGCLAAIQQFARQIQDYVDSYCALDNVSWSDSRFDSGSQRAGDTLAGLSFGGTLTGGSR